MLESAEMSTGECSVTSGSVRLENVSAGRLIGSSRGAVRATEVDVDEMDDMHVESHTTRYIGVLDT